MHTNYTKRLKEYKTQTLIKLEFLIAKFKMLQNRAKFLFASVIFILIFLFINAFFANNMDSKIDESLSALLNNEALESQQDDPKLVDFVRKHFIHPPSKLGYNLNEMNGNPSYGQLQSVLHLLRNDNGGFFIEAGANDGEWGSNTLYLERVLGWNGLLVEASPQTYAKLLKKNRKAWHSNAALSSTSHPMKATFFENPDNSLWGGLSFKFYHKNAHEVEVQCIPLYTMLLAINQTEVDFLSLDLEGSELDVLRTIPFDKVDIKVISMEVINGKEGPEAVKEFMRSNSFHHIATVGDLGDLIFINDELYQQKKPRWRRRRIGN